MKVTLIIPEDLTPRCPRFGGNGEAFLRLFEQKRRQAVFTQDGVDIVDIVDAAGKA